MRIRTMIAREAGLRDDERGQVQSLTRSDLAGTFSGFHRNFKRNLEVGLSGSGCAGLFIPGVIFQQKVNGAFARLQWQGKLACHVCQHSRLTAFMMH